jgi:atypical dual specificity phosphatase
MSDSISYPNYLWWVIPERLAGMPRPPLEDLPQLYQAGLRGVVSVIDEPSLLVEYKKAGLSALSLPITEDQAPTVQQVQEFVTFADEIMSQKQSVAVHCTGGNHRTGTLLATYLVAQGENPDDVIESLKQIHSTAQLSEPQIHFLHQLPQLLELETKT